MADVTLLDRRTDKTKPLGRRRTVLYASDTLTVSHKHGDPLKMVMVSRRARPGTFGWSSKCPFWKVPGRMLKHRGQAGKAAAYQTGRKQGRREGKRIGREQRG